MNAVISISPSDSATESVRQFSRHAIGEWLTECQQFLDYHPASEELPQHLAKLKWLMRFTRSIHATAVDPDFPDRQIADELEGRLIQLEHALRQFNNPMSGQESDKLADEIFA